VYTGVSLHQATNEGSAPLLHIYALHPSHNLRKTIILGKALALHYGSHRWLITMSAIGVIPALFKAWFRADKSSLEPYLLFKLYSWPGM